MTDITDAEHPPMADLMMMPMPSDEEVAARIREYAAVTGVSMAQASEGMRALAAAFADGARSLGEASGKLAAATEEP